MNKEYLKALKQQVASLNAEHTYKTAYMKNLERDLRNADECIEVATRRHAQLLQEVADARTLATDLLKRVNDAKSKVGSEHWPPFDCSLGISLAATR